MDIVADNCFFISTTASSSTCDVPNRQRILCAFFNNSYRLGSFTVLNNYHFHSEVLHVLLRFNFNRLS